MPGMMDTILNLGINDDVAATLAAKSGNVRWAYDSYRRFIMMFSDVAMGYDRLKFEAIMDEAARPSRGVATDAGLTADDMQGDRRALQGPLQGARRRGVPHRPEGPAHGRCPAPCSAPG